MMKKANFGRILSFVLAMVIVMTTVTANTTTAFAANSNVRLFVEKYNRSVTAREGEKYSELVRRLQPAVKAQIGAGEAVMVPTVYEEAGQYVHAGKNGKAKVTFTYNGAKTSLSIKVKVTTKKLTAKTKGKLYEAQTLSDARKVVRATLTYSDGKKVKNFKGFTCKQEGKVVKANKKGTFKVKISNGKKSATCEVKVVSIKRIYVSYVVDSLPEGTAINKSSLKATLKAVYADGKVKTLKNYSVSAPKKATGKSVKVKFSYGKFSKTVSIPVKKSTTAPAPVPTPTPVPNPNPKPEEPGTEEPTPKPETVEVSASVEGEGTATVNGKSNDIIEKGSEATWKAEANEGSEFKGWKKDNESISTDSVYTEVVNEDMALVAVFEKVEDPGTEKPVDPTPVDPTPATPVDPEPTTAELKVQVTGGEGTITLDDEEIQLPASLKLEKGSYTLAITPNDGCKLKGWMIDGEEYSTRDTITIKLSQNMVVEAILEKTCTLEVVREGKGTVVIDNSTLSFQNGIASKKLVTGTHTFSQKANEGYQFVALLDAEGKQLLTENGTFEVTEDTTVTVIFKKFYTVNYSQTAGSNGKVTIGGTTLEGTMTFTYVEGTEVSAKAISTSDWRFEHWADRTSGTILSTESNCVLTVAADMDVVAVYERIFTLRIERNSEGIVKLDGKTLEFTNDVAEKVVTAGKHKLEAISTDDHEFYAYLNENDRVVSRDLEYDVPVSVNTTVKVNFVEIGKTVSVTYQHANGQLITMEAVKYNSAPESFPTKDMQKDNETFMGWKLNETIYYGKLTDKDFVASNGNKLTDDIKALTAQKQNVLLVSYYEKDAEVFHTVKFSGGTLSYNGQFLESGSSVKAGASVTLVADEAPEGQFFAGWYNGDELVWQTATYPFYVNSDVELVAKYDTIEIKPEPRVYFAGSGDKITRYPETGKYVWNIIYDIPDDYTIVERGVIVVTCPVGEVVEPESLSLDNIDGSRMKKVKCSTTNMSWNNTSSYPAEGVNKIFKAYAVISGIDGQKTVYSDEVISLY